MRVAVTGAAGFIGSHIVEELVTGGHQVLAIDGLLAGLYPAEVKRSVFDGLPEQGVDRVVADLRAADLVELLDGVDAVINEAAMPGQAVSWLEFELYASCNLTAVQRLAEACLEAGVGRLVQVSTSSAYGRNAVGNEGLPLAPISPYGVTKVAAEALVQAYVRERGLDAVILRYFSVYGPRQRPDMAYHLFCEALLDDRELTVFGDGRQSRSNTYVTDVAAATIAALTAGDPGLVANIAGGESIALLDALEVLADALGAEPRIAWQPAQVGDQRDTRGDAGLAREVLGWTPQVGVREGLTAQAAWHRGRRADSES